MPRYFSRPRAWVEDDVYVDPPQFVPSVPEHVAIDTGLIDADGNAIMRAPNPIGFGKNDEWG